MIKLLLLSIAIAVPIPSSDHLSIKNSEEPQKSEFSIFNGSSAESVGKIWRSGSRDGVGTESGGKMTGLDRKHRTRTPTRTRKYVEWSQHID